MARKAFSVTVLAFLLHAGLVSSIGEAQKPKESGVEVAVTFNAQRSLELNSNQNFWADGGSIELGADAFRGFGIAANVSGVHSGSIGSSGIPLSLVTETFGPRYRWHDGHRFSCYGEGLIGEANAFRSFFPSAAGAQTDATSFASQVGGGLDLHLKRHLAARLLEASWLRTQLPNSAGNVQNNLRLGAGVVLKLGR
ncbi:MAG TPA: hypothetical protein VKV02_04720 [Acidobacteriaceae bacterium]|nr:hypothetical protein [Acidobacteriaceae bacterium]